MNEPVTPTTPKLYLEWRAALDRCEVQVTERDERIKCLERQLERLPHAEAERIQALNDYRELEKAYHKLLNDYRCALATLKAAVEVAQYELEYVTLNQAKPSV